MSDALTFTEIDRQRIELLPARTLMSMLRADGSTTAGDGTGGSGGTAGGGGTTGDGGAGSSPAGQGGFWNVVAKVLSNAPVKNPLSG